MGRVETVTSLQILQLWMAGMDIGFWKMTNNRQLTAEAVSKRTKKIFSGEIYSIYLSKQDELLIVTTTFLCNSSNIRLIIPTGIGDFTFWDSLGQNLPLKKCIDEFYTVRLTGNWVQYNQVCLVTIQINVVSSENEIQKFREFRRTIPLCNF